MPSWRVLRTSEKWFTASDLYDLRGERYIELDVEIVSVSQGEANQPGSDKTKKLPALTLRSLRSGKPLPKPLGLNVTNGLAIEQIANTDDYKRWPGTRLTLFVIPDAKFGRERRPAIRVRPTAPSSGQRSNASAQTSAPSGPAADAADNNTPPPIDGDEARELEELERKRLQEEGNGR